MFTAVLSPCINQPPKYPPPAPIAQATSSRAAPLGVNGVKAGSASRPPRAAMQKMAPDAPISAQIRLNDTMQAPYRTPRQKNSDKPVIARPSLTRLYVV